MFTKLRYENHFIVFYKGKIIYKQWLNKDHTRKTEPSWIDQRPWLGGKIIQDKKEY